jgi:cobalt-zinc-cadmium efflux system outer membrane protein
MRLLSVNRICLRVVALVGIAVLPASAPAAGVPLPDPLQLGDVTRIALRDRAEVSAANSRAEALAQRPAIVGALEDPMVSPSIDHYPFEMMDDEEGGRRYDWSITVEQRFPLSGVRGHRRAAARAEAQRATALAAGTKLDVVLEAKRSFFMLLERRRMSVVIEEQMSLARQLVRVASSRYASGTGPQADVLRAEVEVARVQADQQSLAALIRAAEAMLNANLGRPVQEPIPQLQHASSRTEPALASAVLDRASTERPELIAGAAEVDRAAAEL